MENEEKYTLSRIDSMTNSTKTLKVSNVEASSIITSRATFLASAVDLVCESYNGRIDELSEEEFALLKDVFQLVDSKISLINVQIRRKDESVSMLTTNDDVEAESTEHQQINNQSSSSEKRRTPIKSVIINDVISNNDKVMIDSFPPPPFPTIKSFKGHHDGEKFNASNNASNNFHSSYESDKSNLTPKTLDNRINNTNITVTNHLMSQNQGDEEECLLSDAARSRADTFLDNPTDNEIISDSCITDKDSDQDYEIKIITSEPSLENEKLPVNLSSKSRRLSHPFLSRNESHRDIDNNPSVDLNQGSHDDPQQPTKGIKNILKRKLSATIHPNNYRLSVLRKPSNPIIISANDTWKTVAEDAFKIIDNNGDGFLQKEEVIAAIKMMEENGMDLNTQGKDPAEIAEKMMSEVDIDGDGLIDINEFIEMMRKNVPGKSRGSLISYNHRMSQLAKNVLLAHQKKIENSVIGHDIWMIHPHSNFHAIWDIIVSILILLTVITLPLSMGWDELNEDFFVVNLLVDIIFLLDVGKNFCTGIVDQNDSVIMDKRIVRRQYLTGYFLSDICSSIPLDLIFRIAGLNETSGGSVVSGTKNSLKMLRILRLAKLFRLLRISRLFHRIKDFILWFEECVNIRISDGFTKLLRLGIGALVLGHWMGCFNFMLVRQHDFPEDSWVVYAGLVDRSIFSQWSWSFYKALAQIIMIGFQTPPFTSGSCDTTSDWCSIEHWVTLGCLYIGAVFYSLLISSISSILQTANLASRQFEQKLIQIDEYMRSKKLPAPMREKVKDYFHLQHSNGKHYDENEILDMLTPVLKREIKIFTGRDITIKVPILSAVTNKGFAEEMVTIIEPMIAFQNEILMREKTSGEEMYFISSGVVEIYLAEANNSSYVAIGDGCYFGEVSILLGIKRIASVRTKTQCMLFKISKTKLLSILLDFPDTHTAMVKIAESRHRRLKHYVNPTKYNLLPEDEIDAEDCKTELFGADAKEIVSVKEEEILRARVKNRQSHRMATVQPNQSARYNTKIMPSNRRR